MGTIRCSTVPPGQAFKPSFMSAIGSICKGITRGQVEKAQDDGICTRATHERTDIQEKDKKKAKNKQNRARSGKDQVKSKSKVIHVKKMQLEGLKLPNLKLYYKRKRQGSKLQTKQRLHSSYTT
ncbi:hypothetical protein Tco_1408903 [Tanacetum coccineum]